ncbi:hypothetical protein [Capnocytophaga stomatis]|uniref:hypothetical protein n=1 Tax=Capnocytophaga stomatis TaxID=1848904 RepID=UPI001AC2A0D2|nr:hypothetical protein [Capnocytophaga stomatis]GIM50953.1 hypothetical protein CAPN003_24050 [Capnocytophaga stomatis]
MAGIRVTLKSTGQQMVAKLEIEDCFICDDPHIFIKALIKIAYNVGQKSAEQKIKQQLNGFTSEGELDLIKSVGIGNEIKITGKFPKYKEPKGFYNSVLRVLGGLNVVDYTSNMELYGQNIPYKGEIFVKEEPDFHIYSVSDPQSGDSIASGKTYHALIFYNKDEKIVVKLFFETKKDLFLIWETYYLKMKRIYEQSSFQEYDKKNGTNFYNIFKK